jgi:ubiquitin-like 1-activating enzyme E1 A
MAGQVGTALSPVAAVVGGMLGQEVVKLVSRKDKPIRNVFIFDAMGGTGGTVACVPSE